MSSPFINLALALPEGLDEAASALFVLGKDTLDEPESIALTLDDDAVRSTRRGKVPAAVTAIHSSKSPAALAAHQGDSRVLVQRALAANQHTPEQTLLWLLRGALRRSDREVLRSIMHRLPLDAAFQALQESSDARATVNVAGIAARAAQSEEWADRFARLPISNLTGRIVAECIIASRPFEHLLENTTHVERELAQAVAHLGVVHPALTPLILKACVTTFVSALPGTTPKISRDAWEALYEAFAASGNHKFNDRMLLSFSPEDDCVEAYRKAFFATNERYQLLDPTLELMGVSDPDELHALLDFAVPRISEYQMHRVFAALPENALQQTRDVVIMHLSSNVLAKYLTTDGLLREGDAPALAGHHQAERFVGKLWDSQVTSLPWYPRLLEAFGNLLLGLVGTNRMAARYVAGVFAEHLPGNTAGVVLAAKLINEGFTGSLEELIATVKVIHPNPSIEEPVIDTAEPERAQLLLF
jgi:hypothetical protein